MFSAFGSYMFYLTLQNSGKYFNMKKQQKIEISIEFSSIIYRKDKKDT